MLSEAPGHLFLDYEDSDLITFLQMTITSGWDAEVIPELRYGAAGDARVALQSLALNAVRANP